MHISYLQQKRNLFVPNMQKDKKIVSFVKNSNVFLGVGWGLKPVLKPLFHW